MVELFQRSLDVPWHAQVDESPCVVSIERDADVFFSHPIVRNVVVFLQSVHEMMDVLPAGIFYAKVVNYQCERDWSRFVRSQPRYHLALKIPLLVQTFLEQLVCNDPCLR